MSRDKQEKFAGVQKLAERKRILQETVSRNQKESAKLANEVQPIKDKIAKKESEVREKIDLMRFNYCSIHSLFQLSRTYLLTCVTERQNALSWDRGRGGTQEGNPTAQDARE
jgi:hypothetical protein